MPTPHTGDGDIFDIANISFFPGRARIAQDISIAMRIWAKVEVGDYVIITLPWFTSSGCDPTVKGPDLVAADFTIWDNTRNSISFNNKFGNSSNTPGWSAAWHEGDASREYANAKLILRPTRTIPWRQHQYLTIGTCLLQFPGCSTSSSSIAWVSSHPISPSFKQMPSRIS
jgi:hypothetical protein